jgi:hypothetical protein
LDDPITVVPFRRKSTRATAAPLPAEAVAVRVAGVPTTKAVPFVGLVRVAIGEVVVTMTATVGELTSTPFESVTRAEIDWVPVATGVQVVE